MDISFAAINITETFLVEANELLDACEKYLLELEKDSSENMSYIKKLFRAAHTLKGSSLAAGFEEIGSVVHVAEDLIGQMQSEVEFSNKSIDQDIIDILFQTVDIIRHNLSDPTSETINKKNIEHINDLSGFLNDSSSLKPLKKTMEPMIFDVPDPIAAEPEKSKNLGNIVICDDDTIVLSTLSERVNSLGYRSIAFDNPNEALAEIKKNSEYEVIITDLKMQQMDGIEFVSSVFQVTDNVPVIFCSGYAEKDDLSKFIDLGVYVFIEKPLNSGNLEAVLSSAVTKKRTNDNLNQLLELTHKAFISSNKIVFADDSIGLESKKHQYKLKKYFDKICSLLGATLSLNREDD